MCDVQLTSQHASPAHPRCLPTTAVSWDFPCDPCFSFSPIRPSLGPTARCPSNGNGVDHGRTCRSAGPASPRLHHVVLRMPSSLCTSFSPSRPLSCIDVSLRACTRPGQIKLGCRRTVGLDLPLLPSVCQPGKVSRCVVTMQPAELRSGRATAVYGLREASGPDPCGYRICSICWSSPVVAVVVGQNS